MKINQSWLQDAHLTNLQENVLNCTIITKNGVHMQGIILQHDKFTVLFKHSTGLDSLIYKHAISTIK